MCSGHTHSITGGVRTAVDGTYAGCIYSGCALDIHTVSRAVYVRRWTVHTQAVFTPDVPWTYTQYHRRCTFGSGRYIRRLYLPRMCSGHTHSITGGVRTAVDGTYAGCTLDIHTVSRAVCVRRWTVHTRAVFTPDVLWTYTQYHGRCAYGGGRYIRGLIDLLLASDSPAAGAVRGRPAARPISAIGRLPHRLDRINPPPAQCLDMLI